MRNTLSVLLLMLAALPSFGGIITNWMTDPSGVPVNMTVRFGLLSSPYGRTNQFIVRKPIVADVVNGVLYTNLVAGLYQADFGSDYGTINILMPEGAGPYDLMTIATNLSTWNVTNYLNVFTLASLITDYGTAAYSNVTAFLLSYQTNQPLSQITNAGTAAYSNAAAFLLSYQTNQPLSQITNAGNAAYSNSTAFLLSYQTNQPLSQITNAGTAAYSNASAFMLSTASYGASNAITFYTSNANWTARVTNVITFTNGAILSWTQ